MQRRTWWILLVLLSVLHFAVLFALIVLRYTTYYDKPFTLEPLMDLMMLPVGWFPIRNLYADVQVPALIVNSILWGFITASGIRLLWGWELSGKPRDLLACVHCGYDLRASGETCPECGASNHRPHLTDESCG